MDHDRVQGSSAAGQGSGFQPTPFRPAWWLPGAHAQTIAGRVLRRPRPLPLRRLRIATPDGDFLDIDFAPAPHRDAPLVLLLHGLEGSARRGYAINAYRALADLGMAAAGLNFRSCSGEPNRAPRLYHSGETEDLRFVLRHLREHGSPVAAAIGFSLGGNVLLKFLGEEGDSGSDWLRTAVAVSVPYDLAAGADALDRSFMGRIYTRHFLRSLTAKALARAALLDGRVDRSRILCARSFREFDDAATAPLHGFASADDYYARSSSAAFLSRIRVPTLLLHAEDDPFLPAAALPTSAIRANAYLTMHFVSAGGHVGFIAGPPWQPVWWVEQEAARYLSCALGAGATDSRAGDPFPRPKSCGGGCDRVGSDAC
jgi:predicted alpha/beta-fold hydrolase